MHSSGDIPGTTVQMRSNQVKFTRMIKAQKEM